MAMASRERLAELAQRAPIPVVAVNREGRFTYANESFCRLAGFRSNELLGSYFWDFLVGDDAQLRRERFLELRDEGLPTRFHARVRRRDGGDLVIAWHIIAFHDEAGRVREVYGIGADPTALRAAEQQLERVNAALQALGRISRLALRTADPRALLTDACQALVASNACTGAWVLLVGDDGRPVGLTGSPLRDGSAPESAEFSLRRLPPCIERVLAEPRKVAVLDTSQCGPCVFAPASRPISGLATRISHRDRVYGTLIGHVAGPQPVGEEMERLFSTIGGDLGFALATLETDAMHRHTERELAERTRILDAFFERSLDPAAILDRDFNFVRVNHAYAQADEREPHEFVGRNYFEMYPNDENLRIFERVRDTGEPHEAHARPFQYAHNLERGTTYWDSTLVPIHGSGGEVELLSLWLRDVTEEQRARQELLRSREEVRQQRDFVDAVIEKAGGLVLVLDADGRIVRFNEACQKVTGFRAEEVLGRRFWRPLVPEEEHERAIATLSSLAGAEPTVLEGPWLTRDGRRRIISWRISAIPGSDGDMQFAVGTGWDVTEERRMAEALRQSEAKYRELVENAESIIIRVDADGVIRFVNEYGLDFFGYSEEELIGEHIGIIVPDTDSYGRDQSGLVADILQSPTEFAANECENVTKDGRRAWISWSNRSIRDASDGTVGIMAVGVDRTAQKRAEEELRESRENLRDLTARLAMAEQRERREIATALHDHLGQLLAFAKMKLGAAMTHEADESRQELAEVLGFVHEAIGFTRSLTTQLSPPVLDQLGLAAALEWLADDLQQRHGREISVAHSGGPPAADQMDEEVRITLFQAARELILNAIKHTSAGQVEVSLSVSDGNAHLEVADRGEGFDLEELKRGRTGDEGFGLFNIQERVGYLGGRVEIESAPAAGTTVRLVCPLRSRESAT